MASEVSRIEKRDQGLVVLVVVDGYVFLLLSCKWTYRLS